jgi:hypothetical protein
MGKNFSKIIKLTAPHNCYQCCQGAEISAARHKRGRTKWCGAGKVWGRTFGRIIKKGPKRGRTFFLVWFCTEIVIFLTEHCDFLLIYSIFSYLWIFGRTKNISFYKYILQGAELFRQRPKFLVNMAENVCLELATLIVILSFTSLYTVLVQECSKCMKSQIKADSSRF